MKILAGLLAFILIAIPVNISRNTYTLEGCEVYTVESYEDGELVVVEDQNDNLWQFETEAGFEWDENTRITLRMNENGTKDDIYDDRIIGVDVE